VVESKRDEELLAEHLQGTAGAFDQLVDRYANDLYAFFSRFVGNRSAAEDLVQDTMLQVHLSAGGFDPQRSFKPWLYTIAANKGRDFMRSRRRRPTHSLDAFSGEGEGPTPAGLVEDEDPGAAAQLDDAEQRKRVQAVIAELPDHLQLILVLGYYQRLAYAEIAQILEIPVGTVKSRLHSAVNQFAKLWLKHYPHEDVQRGT
jgi:RNA polymerase sigma-70 factor (ECF subfamily)